LGARASRGGSYISQVFRFRVERPLCQELIGCGWSVPGCAHELVPVPVQKTHQSSRGGKTLRFRVYEGFRGISCVIWDFRAQRTLLRAGGPGTAPLASICTWTSQPDPAPLFHFGGPLPGPLGPSSAARLSRWIPHPSNSGTGRDIAFQPTPGVGIERRSPSPALHSQDAPLPGLVGSLAHGWVPCEGEPNEREALTALTQPEGEPGWRRRPTPSPWRPG